MTRVVRLRTAAPRYQPPTWQPARPAQAARRGRVGLLVALAGLAVSAACHDSAVDRRIRYRRDSVVFAADSLTWRERDAGKRLGHSAEFIREDVARDVRETVRDLRMLRGYIEFDLRRFGERLPIYGEKTGEILLGRPQDIGPTAIIMFL